MLELLGEAPAISTVLPIVFFVVTLFVLKEFWFARITANFLGSIKWITLELSIPKENIKSVKSMEQVFGALYEIYSFGFRPWETLVEGKVEYWISFEIVGTAHTVHFYVHAPRKYRNLVEASFFSQYPDMEIKEVEDYTKRLPRSPIDEGYDLFGLDNILGKDDAYPLRTYMDMEDDSEEDKKNIDPISVVVEAMTELEGDEYIFLQLLARPAGPDWTDKAKDIIDELAGIESKSKKKGLFTGTGEFVQNLARAPMLPPEWSGAGEDQKLQSFHFYTPGEQEILKAMSRKVAKRAYESILRYLYIGKKETFNLDNAFAIMGAIQQYGTESLNYLRPNSHTLTLMYKVAKYFPYIPLRRRLLKKRKERMYNAYVERAMPQKHIPQHRLKLRTSILNVEELATLFHPPTVVVKAPKLQTIESRKSEPPVNLPVKKK